MPEEIPKEARESAIANSNIKAVLTQVQYATTMLHRPPTLDQVIERGSNFETRSKTRVEEITEILRFAAREKYVKIDEHGGYILTSKGQSKVEMSHYSGN